MSARSYHLARVVVEGQPLEGVVHGGFHVPPPAGPEEPAQVAWRLHLATTRRMDWQPNRHYALVVETLEGPAFEVSGRLVDTDGKAHDFAGVGLPDALATPLTGEPRD